MAQRGKIGFNIILKRQVTMISKNRKGQRQETIDLEVETVMLKKKMQLLLVWGGRKYGLKKKTSTEIDEIGESS